MILCNLKKKKNIKGLFSLKTLNARISKSHFLSPRTYYLKNYCTDPPQILHTPFAYKILSHKDVLLFIFFIYNRFYSNRMADFLR